MANTLGKLLILTLVTVAGAAGCDEHGDAGRGASEEFRTGGYTGAGLTLNTNQWVSSSARDIYEFTSQGSWHPNSFGYETKLVTIALPSSPVGPVTTTVGATPAPGQPVASIVSGADFGIRITVPGPAPDPLLMGTQLIGLELSFTVRGAGGSEHAVVLQVADHTNIVGAGDFYELHKLDPATGTPIAPLCEEDSSGLRMARIFDGLSVHGETGAMTLTAPGIRHIACTSSAAGKAATFGYAPFVLDPVAFELAARVIRADYCADGYPYTYPGNLLGIEDNMEGTTLADVQAGLAEGEALEAVWDAHGVLCIEAPRASNVDREDVVCPIKRFADGSIAYNWRPPSCEGWVDGDPGDLRFFSKSSE